MENKIVKIEDILKINELKQKEILIKYTQLEDKQGGIDIKVMPNLDISKRVEMINEILKIVVDGDIEDYDIKNYRPCMLNFAKRYTTIEYFTNIDLDADIHEIYKIIMHTDIYQRVYEQIKEELDLIFEEANEKVKTYIDVCKYNKNYKSIMNKLKRIFDVIENKIESFDIGNILELLKDKNIDYKKLVNKFNQNGFKKELAQMDINKILDLMFQDTEK